MIEIKDKKYMEIKEYANKYGVSLKTVYNWIKAGKVKTKKMLNAQLIEIA